MKRRPGGITVILKIGVFVRALEWPQISDVELRVFEAYSVRLCIDDYHFLVGPSLFMIGN